MFTMMPDFVDKYSAREIGEMRATGATEAAIAAKKKEMDQLKVTLNNPLLNIAMTFIEPFPVGLIITVISAAVLRKKPQPQPAQFSAEQLPFAHRRQERRHDYCRRRSVGVRFVEVGSVQH